MANIPVLFVCAPNCSVSGVQPILAAIDSIAAHCELYSLAASLTMRTARSMTSGEYLGCFFLAPFSQTMEPPQNPGRFTCQRAANASCGDRIARARMHQSTICLTCAKSWSEIATSAATVSTNRRPQLFIGDRGTWAHREALRRAANAGEL